MAVERELVEALKSLTEAMLRNSDFTPLTPAQKAAIIKRRQANKAARAGADVGTTSKRADGSTWKKVANDGKSTDWEKVRGSTNDRFSAARKKRSARRSPRLGRAKRRRR